jgi:uncharacterized membrane protein YkvA (DUF1232 family)
MVTRADLRKDLEQLIHAHGAFARAALEMLDDQAIANASKVPLAAAAHYGAEKLDLIPDDFPAYGLVDDLFVLAIGIHGTLDGDEGARSRYAPRELGMRTLDQHFEVMRTRFYGFWEFCRQQTAEFFGQFQTAFDENNGAVRAARDELAAEVDEIFKLTSQTILRPEDVEAFLARFRSFNSEDLE